MYLLELIGLDGSVAAGICLHVVKDRIVAVHQDGRFVRSQAVGLCALHAVDVLHLIDGLRLLEGLESKSSRCLRVSLKWCHSVFLLYSIILYPVDPPLCSSFVPQKRKAPETPEVSSNSHSGLLPFLRTHPLTSLHPGSAIRCLASCFAAGTPLPSVFRSVPVLLPGSARSPEAAVSDIVCSLCGSCVFASPVVYFTRILCPA